MVPQSNETPKVAEAGMKVVNIAPQAVGSINVT